MSQENYPETVRITGHTWTITQRNGVTKCLELRNAHSFDAMPIMDGDDINVHMVTLHYPHKEDVSIILHSIGELIEYFERRGVVDAPPNPLFRRGF